MKNKVLAALDDRLADMLSSRDAFKKHFSRDDLNTYLEFLISSHSTISNVLESFTSKYQIAMALKMKDKAFVKQYNLSGYIDYKKRLVGAAAKKEAAGFISSLEYANKEYQSVLESIQDNLDKYFTNDKINLFNTRISHVVLIGVMYQSELLTKYIKYMLSYISLTLSGNSSDLPKYREVFMYTNVSAIAKIVNSIYKGAGAKDYKGMLKNIKVNAADFNLLSESNVIQVNKADHLKLSDDSRRVMTMGIFGLTVFRSLGESVNIMSKWLHTERVIEQEWLKAHTTLLMYKLNDMDEEDPEYIKLSRIVMRYEATINKQQRKIDKYN